MVEGGATGDVSERSRGVTPELTLAIATRDGWRLYGFASRRFERRLDGDVPLPGEAGTDEADLTRRSRALYRAGRVGRTATGENVSVEASRREINGHVPPALRSGLPRPARLALLLPERRRDRRLVRRRRHGSARRSTGASRCARASSRASATASIQSDDATWGVAQAAVRVRATDTSLGIGYRVVAQSLTRGATVLHNDVEAVDFSLAQSIPVPALRSIGSDWRALFSVEFGKRREGEDEEKLEPQARRWPRGLVLALPILGPSALQLPGFTFKIS